MDFNHLIEVISVITVPLSAIFITHFVDVKKFHKDTLFTYEIDSYRSLIIKINEMIDSVFYLFPHGLIYADNNNDKNEKQKLYDSAYSATMAAYREIVCDDIFLNKALSDKIHTILQLCNEQLRDYKFVNANDSDYPREEKGKLHIECVNRNKELEKLNQELMEDLKKYIKGKR